MGELIDFAEPIEVLFLDGGRVRLVQSLPGKEFGFAGIVELPDG